MAIGLGFLSKMSQFSTVQIRNIYFNKLVLAVYTVHSLIVVDPRIVIWTISAGGHVSELWDTVFVRVLKFACGGISTWFFSPQVVALTHKLSVDKSQWIKIN